jgi:predicted transcriptional regulator
MKLERAIFDDVDEAAEAAADAQAIAEIEAGQFVSHKAVEAWLLSWGTPNKLPTPKVGD